MMEDSYTVAVLKLDSIIHAVSVAINAQSNEVSQGVLQVSDSK